MKILFVLMTSSKNGGHFGFFLWLNLNLLLHWTSMQSFIEISQVVRELGRGGNFTPPPTSKRDPKKPTQIRVKVVLLNLTKDITKLDTKHNLEISLPYWNIFPLKTLQTKFELYNKLYIELRFNFFGKESLQTDIMVIKKLYIQNL